MVAYDFDGAAILAVPFVEEDVCELFCSDVGCASCKLDVCSEVVCHGNDLIETIIEGKWTNEVDCNGVETMVRDWQGV